MASATMTTTWTTSPPAPLVLVAHARLSGSGPTNGCAFRPLQCRGPPTVPRLSPCTPSFIRKRASEQDDDNPLRLLRPVPTATLADDHLICDRTSVFDPPRERPPAEKRKERNKKENPPSLVEALGKLTPSSPVPLCILVPKSRREACLIDGGGPAEAHRDDDTQHPQLPQILSLGSD